MVGNETCHKMTGGLRWPLNYRRLEPGSKRRSGAEDQGLESAALLAVWSPWFCHGQRGTLDAGMTINKAGHYERFPDQKKRVLVSGESTAR